MEESPCQKVCKLDFEYVICTTCFRMLDEIRDWSKYSNEEKREVKRLAKLRKVMYNEEIERPNGEGLETT